ncbi:MAG TPA: exopolysaccharide biosynthesis polyprenyl glycosylphosphotransferase [Caulobacteraceae bacterium]
MRPRRLLPARSRLGARGAAMTFQALDAGLLLLLAYVSAVAAADGPLLQAELGRILPFVTAAFGAAWGLRLFNAYAYNLAEGLHGHLGRVAAAFAVAAVAGFAAVFLFSTPRAVAAVAIWVASALALVSVLHVWGWERTRVWRREGRMTPNVVFVGATPNAQALIERALESGEVSVLGVFDDRHDRAPASIKGVPVLGDVDALLSHRILPCVDRIVITVTTSAQGRVRQLIERLRTLPNEVTLFIDVEGGERRGNALSRVTGAPLSFLPGRYDEERRAFRKRVQDLVLAVVALVLAAPVMLAVALAVKLDSPGPILFRQRRHGFNNEVVTVWKFRSMRHDASDATARRQVTADDDRITRVGRFIRQTSLDELPQLLNVLRGEMSIVGPRPHAIGMRTGQAEASRLVAEYAWRHRIKPGITGWAQINGSRGPVHTAADVRRRVMLDIEYIERQSLRLDLWIVLMTIPCLLGDRLAVR